MNDLEESNRQFIEAWEMYARRAENGFIRERDGIAAAFCGVAMPLMNMVFLTSPITDAADLDRRLELAHEVGRASERPWIFTLCEDWLPPAVHARAPAILGAAGMAPVSTTTGMVADELARPRRAPPPELAIRPVDSEAARRLVADLNTCAHHMPAAWGYEALGREELFGADVWGEVGYVGETAVSTSTTALVDRRLYVMMVATAAGHTQKGYAEAVIRHSLARAMAKTSVRRTVLHATVAGQPLYASMGYRATSRFTMYMTGAHAA